jgi:predicted DNA-binding transcriptional regulator AlpA
MPTKNRNQKTEPDATFATAPQVCLRYGGVSHMWLERRLKNDPKFPRPRYFGRLRFFKISELEEYERQCTSSAAA